ncbi:60 kDa SS-A/Ro ribonucleoprotein-like [Neodiprion virginianus]|uniref:60 kDa SS-A/Ro ribonucleoprotein-like n=1 Tax=Neodiprion virginianus TaxID=2961670 RepID=UPI001EE7134E|nr:60 kDa SS-A/Ro ribonucleoprotein-like [Neodiprion virginianus]XP_046611311.1 60 kDa SS-A/Ro ribonucleoprotein-like [Neodiprion virginianus]XP_046611312.1 60 kDa SS-A/Ro ribonucleoprotein-like [Neodiprion virginianus]
MAEPALSGDSLIQLEVRLCQYLYVGKEYPNYQPGNWFFHKYYEEGRVQSIKKIAETQNPLVAIDLIKKAFERKLVQNSETLIFALAVCARQTENESLRHAAYNAIKTICTTPQHFILFVKFASQIAKSAPEPKHGWGAGWRKAVNEWYLSKDALDLAKCVTGCKGRYGWTHKDIVKLSHPKTDDIAKKAVLKYVLFGLKETIKDFGDKPEAAEVIEYIQKIENFKHCEDQVLAGRLLELHNLTLDHVPGHLLKSEEVWNSLIPTMNITMLLHNLQRMHNIGILEPTGTAVDKVVDEICNQEKLLKEKIHPALVLITIKNYEKSGPALSYEKQKARKAKARSVIPPPKPTRKIIEALYKTLGYSFNSLAPTGLRYMITIDMSKAMQDNSAWRCGNLSSAEAGCLIALCLLRSENNVTVATFKNIGVHIVYLNKNASLGQIVKKMKQMPTGEVNLEKPMIWAAQKSEEIDVFINVVDVVDKRCGNGARTDNPRKAIKEYRSKMELKNAKLVTCAMTTAQMVPHSDDDKNTLTICGFDENVPKIIEAFARSLF